MKRIRFLYKLLALGLSIFSCSTEGELQQLIGRETKAPVFLDCRALSPTEMVFNFSHSVQVLSLAFEPALETDTIDYGSEVKVTFVEELAAGMKVTADLLVEDSDGNTLNVIVPFRARNDRMPPLVFNELRTEYSKPRVEFVEFIAREAGNLGAMRLFIAGNSPARPIHEFPPVEVEAGEYIVLHLRTIEDGCVDETGTDLTISGGSEALDTARDFWVPGASKLLRKTDALWLLDQDDRIIDAVLLSEASDGKWGNENVAAASEYLGSQKAWLPALTDDETDDWLPGPMDAVLSAGTTATRTICRDESLPQSPRLGNWYITATSSATPGKSNSTKRYAP